MGPPARFAFVDRADSGKPRRLRRWYAEWEINWRNQLFNWKEVIRYINPMVGRWGEQCVYRFNAATRSRAGTS